MTYKRIAELAGVSVSTVSKALAGSPEISSDTVSRIRKIADENLVSRPKYHKNRSDIRVAILVPEIVSVFYSQKVTELMNELENEQIDPAIYVCGFGGEKFTRIIDSIAADRSADGIISVSSAEYAHNLDIPIVYLSKEPRYIGYDSVYANVGASIYEAVEYLAHLGHTKIGFIGEKYTEAKLEHFNRSMEQLGIKPDPRHIFISSKRFEEIGYEAAEHLAHLRSRPTALLAAYDEVALGAIHTFRSHGISVPDDISIIGINDIPFAAYAEPPLTTIRTYSLELTRLAVRILLDKIRSPDSHMIQHTCIQCELVIRGSTAKFGEKT